MGQGKEWNCLMSSHCYILSSYVSLTLCPP